MQVAHPVSPHADEAPVAGVVSRPHPPGIDDDDAGAVRYLAQPGEGA